MSILADQDTRLLVQGITGREGSFHTQQMIEYGTQVVAGVTPGRGGQEHLGVPVFNTVQAAVQATDATASCIFVPAPFGADAILEAADAGLDPIVAITEGIPVLDMLRVYHTVRQRGARLIGPNGPGLISPGQAKVGIIQGAIVTPGPIGLVSRSGTLTYEVIQHLTNAGLGQSTCVGIGGDPIVGSSFIDMLALFETDPATAGIVLIGEIGGDEEEQAAEYAQAHVGKPVVRSSASSPGGRRPRRSAWGTPARSSPAAPAPPPARSKRCRPRASRSPSYADGPHPAPHECRHWASDIPQLLTDALG